MRELSFLGIYALLGALLVGTPLIDSGMLFSGLSGITAQKVFWIQLIVLFLSVTFLLSSLFHKVQIFYSWTWIDSLPIALFVLVLLSYPYPIDPEPEKILFIGQITVLWYILRYLTNRFPVLYKYYLFLFLAIGLIEAIWGFRQLQGWEHSNHSLFRLTGSFFNPGPYSGYLAVTLPVALGILLKQPKPNILYYFPRYVYFQSSWCFRQG